MVQLSWLRAARVAGLFSAAIVIGALTMAGCDVGGTSLPYEDDFEGDCTWPEADEHTDLRSCVGGAYRMRSLGEAPLLSTTSFSSEAPALRVEVDSSSLNANETIGVGCFDSDGENGYALAISGDESFAVLYLAPELRGLRVLSKGPGDFRTTGNRLALACASSDAERDTRCLH